MQGERCRDPLVEADRARTLTPAAPAVLAARASTVGRVWVAVLGGEDEEWERLVKVLPAADGADAVGVAVSEEVLCIRVTAVGEPLEEDGRLLDERVALLLEVDLGQAVRRRERLGGVDREDGKLEDDFGVVCFACVGPVELERLAVVQEGGRRARPEVPAAASARKERVRRRSPDRQSAACLSRSPARNSTLTDRRPKDQQARRGGDQAHDARGPFPSSRLLCWAPPATGAWPLARPNVPSPSVRQGRSGGKQRDARLVHEGRRAAVHARGRALPPVVHGRLGGRALSQAPKVIRPRRRRRRRFDGGHGRRARKGG